MAYILDMILGVIGNHSSKPETHQDPMAVNISKILRRYPMNSRIWRVPVAQTRIQPTSGSCNDRDLSYSAFLLSAEDLTQDDIMNYN